MKITIDAPGRKPIIIRLDDEPTEDPYAEERERLMRQFRNAVDALAHATLRGVFQNGNQRVQFQEEAYPLVQHRVNVMLGLPPTLTKKRNRK